MERSLKGLLLDRTFGDDPPVEQDHRYAPVVEVVQALVRVDVQQLGLMAEPPEYAKGVVAEVAAPSSDQNQRRPCDLGPDYATNVIPAAAGFAPPR